MIDIFTAWQFYRRFDVQAIGHIQGDKNSADDTRKLKCNDYLYSIFSCDIGNTTAVLWIDRTSVQFNNNLYSGTE